MEKQIISNLPHPSSDTYAQMKLIGCLCQITGGMYMLGGCSLLTKKNDPAATVSGLVTTTIGIGCFTLGCDIYNMTTNLQNFHKKSFDNAIDKPIEVKAKFVYEAAMKGLLLKRIYRPRYEPIDERALVRLLPKTKADAPLKRVIL